MIQIKRVQRLSANVIGKFSPTSRKAWNDMRHLRALFYSTIDRLWVISRDGVPLCVAGIKRLSALGFGAEIFFMYCRMTHEQTIALLRFLQRAVRRFTCLYGTLLARIEPTFVVGQRFARFFGLRPVVAENNEYLLYEMRSTWLPQR